MRSHSSPIVHHDLWALLLLYLFEEKEENNLSSIAVCAMKTGFHNSTQAYSCLMLKKKMVDWANLPTDILSLVILRLVHMEDFFSMGVVCKAWKSTTSMFTKILSLPPGFPMLLRPSAEVSYEDINKGLGLGVGGIQSLSTFKTYEFELPEATDRKCLGTVRGWLLTVDLDLSANLLHPFSRQQIPLPHFLAFKEKLEDPRSHPQALRQCEVKLAMSRNPLHETTSSEADCVVVVIARFSPLMFFARLGDQVWTSTSSRVMYDDIVYYKGVYYTVNRYGVLFACDINNNEVAPKPVTTPIAIATGTSVFSAQLGARRYLVESSGDLLLVSRLCPQTTTEPARLRLKQNTRGRFLYSAIGFLVHKLEQNESANTGECPYRWKEVSDLGGRALFLGGNSSVSLCSSKRVKPDCIYFAEDEFEMYLHNPGLNYIYTAGWDMGIYNTINGNIEPLDDPSEFRAPNPPVLYI